MERRRNGKDDSNTNEAGRSEEPAEGRPYPQDPGAAYEPEPEPADETFSEHEHWLKRRRKNKQNKQGKQDR